MEQDQNEFLDSALKSVKTSSLKMKNSIDKNDMRQTLKIASELLSELKTSLLSPKNYYQLFSAIFDELIYLQNFFKDESKRGRRLKELYEAVQQSISIIPRIYLLITVGTIFIESDQCEEKEDLIYDMIQMSKGIQNPIRGLFARYFLLKMLKEHFIYIEDIIDNFKDMNRLWIRINRLTNVNLDQIPEMRNYLKVLVGENITRLASLKNLNSEIYREQILIPIIQIICDCNDDISQQYIIECLIIAFPDEYNIKSMDIILNSLPRMNNKLDINNIIITILDKLSKFDNPEKKDDIQANEIFKKLDDSITKIIEEYNRSNDRNNDVMKLIELQNSYLKFIINFNTFDNPETKYKAINEIIGSSYDVLNKAKGNRKMSIEGMKLINKLLSNLLESPISIFRIKNFPDLMSFLEGEYRSSLALRIIDSFVNEFNRGNIDSKDKMESIIEFIRPMIDLNSNYNEKSFENEQNIISKLVYIPCSKIPQEQYEMICILKNAFIDFAKNENVEISNKKLTYYYSNLINALLLLAYGVNEAYGKKKNINTKIKLSKKNKIHVNFANYYNIEQYDLENEDSFLPIFQNIYRTIKDILNELSNFSPNICFKLYLECAQQVNQLKLPVKGRYDEFCYSFLSSALELIVEGKISQEKKFDFLINIIGTVLNNKVLSEENYTNFANNLEQISNSLFKRSEQCISMINCSKLYYSDTLKNKEKLIECLSKAKKYAEYAMTSPNNAILFIYILNEYMKYDLLIPNFDKDINPKIVNELIELIKNYIVTIKSENKNKEIADSIENYFINTLFTIKKKREKNDLGEYGKILSELNLGNI